MMVVYLDFALNRSEVGSVSIGAAHAVHIDDVSVSVCAVSIHWYHW